MYCVLQALGKVSATALLPAPTGGFPGDMQAFRFTLVLRLQEKGPLLRATFFNAQKETEAGKGGCATRGSG